MKESSKTVEVDFDKLVEKVPVALTFLPVLKLLASRQETITYKELGQLFGIHQRAIPGYLHILDIYCAMKKIPHLNHLVVHQHNQLSGGGMVKDAPETFHDQILEQDEIFDYDWVSTDMPTEGKVINAVVKDTIAA